MAKHARPSRARTIARNGARGGAVLALSATGLVAAGSPATAGGDPPPRGVDREHDHRGVKSKHKHEKKKATNKVTNHYQYNYNKTYNHTYNAEHSDHGEDHNSNGLVNVTDNNVQAILQACSNEVPVNVLGVQVIVEDLVGALGLGSRDTGAGADDSENCGQGTYQQDGDNSGHAGEGHHDDDGHWATGGHGGGHGAGRGGGDGGGERHNSNGLVNLTDNNVQIPFQVCNNDVPVNVLGVQVIVEDLTGAAGLGTRDTRAGAHNARTCVQGQGQQDGDNAADLGGLAGLGAHGGGGEDDGVYRHTGAPAARTAGARTAKPARHGAPQAWSVKRHNNAGDGKPARHARPAAQGRSKSVNGYNGSGPGSGHGGSGRGEYHNSNGLVNVADNNVQVPLQACNNNVPVNVLGVQVLVENLTGALGLGSRQSSAEADNSRNCGQGTYQQDGDNTAQLGGFGPLGHGAG